MVTTLLDKKPALGAVLQHGAPVEIGTERLVLAFPKGSFFGRQAETAEARRAIAATAAQILGGEPRVEIAYSDDAIASAKTLAQEATERRDARISATRQRALEHPLIHEIALHFNVPPERMTVRVDLE